MRKLKTAAITLSLANRSIKVPRGLLEEMLVQVAKFYYQFSYKTFEKKRQFQFQLFWDDNS